MTLRVKKSSEAIILDPKTRVHESGHVVSASVLVVGTRVRVVLVPGDHSPTAASVAVLPPELSGTIGTVGPTGFTVVSRSGSVHSVTTTSSTRYRTGKTSVPASTLRSGDHVRVTGRKLAGGSLDASTVEIRTSKTG